MTWKPWTFFLVAVAGWMNRQQQQVIEYLRTENSILREKLGHKRIILNDSQKRRLAAAAMKLGRDLLRQFGTLFLPDTPSAPANPPLAWPQPSTCGEWTSPRSS
jgi:hypothetical protein